MENSTTLHNHWLEFSYYGDNHFYLQFDINSIQCACIINNSSNELILKIREFWNLVHTTLYKMGEFAQTNFKTSSVS